MDDSVTFNNNVYVKNFAEELNDETLKDLFASHGTISSAKVMTGDDGKSRGFGFVSFEEPEAAQRAIDALNGSQVNGRTISCCRALSREDRQAELSQMRIERANRNRGLNLYVKNLHDAVDDERLRQEFAPFGTITSAKVMTTEGGRSKGFGFVCFSTAEAATRAVAAKHSRFIEGKPVYVDFAACKEERLAQVTSRFVQYNAAIQQRLRESARRYSRMRHSALLIQDPGAQISSS